MAALSRNTASVAQDFHNAGGGVKTFTNNHSAEENYRQIIAKHTKQAASTKSPSKSNQLPSIAKWIDYTMASPYVSPPATNPNPDLTTKKRRSTYNKENTENLIPFIMQCNQPDDLQVKNLKQHFDNYIREQFNNPKRLPTNLIDFSPKRSFTFESHPELEVSIQSDSNESNERTNEKRNRKQSQPRKIEQIDEFDVKPPVLIVAAFDEQMDLNNIRDKHLVRMVSRKKCCFKCKNRNKFMMLSYHTTASLILHTKWRHGHEKRLCEMKQCERIGRAMQHKCGLQSK